MGLSVAVLLAGTMIVLLAPALLAIAGLWVFGLPGFLERMLPSIDVEGGVEEEPVLVGEEPVVT